MFETSFIVGNILSGGSKEAIVRAIAGHVLQTDITMKHLAFDYTRDLHYVYVGGYHPEHPENVSPIFSIEFREMAGNTELHIVQRRSFEAENRLSTCDFNALATEVLKSVPAPQAVLASEPAVSDKGRGAFGPHTIAFSFIWEGKLSKPQVDAFTIIFRENYVRQQSRSGSGNPDDVGSITSSIDIMGRPIALFTFSLMASGKRISVSGAVNAEFVCKSSGELILQCERILERVVESARDKSVSDSQQPARQQPAKPVISTYELTLNPYEFAVSPPSDSSRIKLFNALIKWLQTFVPSAYKFESNKRSCEACNNADRRLAVFEIILDERLVSITLRDALFRDLSAPLTRESVRQDLQRIVDEVLSANKASSPAESLPAVSTPTATQPVQKYSFVYTDPENPIRGVTAKQLEVFLDSTRALFPESLYPKASIERGKCSSGSVQCFLSSCYVELVSATTNEAAGNITVAIGLSWIPEMHDGRKTKEEIRDLVIDKLEAALAVKEPQKSIPAGLMQNKAKPDTGWTKPPGRSNVIPNPSPQDARSKTFQLGSDASVAHVRGRPIKH